VETEGAGLQFTKAAPAETVNEYEHQHS